MVVAYGKILPKEMLEIPKFGCINVHASLLPKYRGSAPIQWAVLNGDKVTGVTTMLLDEGMDTGDILLTKEFEIPEEMTSGELFDALSPLGAELLTETVDALESGMIFPKKQDESKATHAPMLSKEMAEIDFSKPAEQIINLIRGMNPWPVAFTAFGDMKIKVYSAKKAGKSSAPAGEVLAGKSLVVSCGDGGSVELCEVQLVGSRRMTSEEMLRGHKIPEGSCSRNQGGLKWDTDIIITVIIFNTFSLCFPQSYLCCGRRDLLNPDTENIQELTQPFV